VWHSRCVLLTMCSWWKSIPSWTQQIIVLLHQGILSMTNYMFRPSGGHHQVYTSFWRESHEFSYTVPTTRTVWDLRTKRNVKITGFLFKNLYKPDDGHQMAETCSLSSIEYLDAIKLYFCCVHDGILFHLLYIVKHPSCTTRSTR
jgi:hypothetical protein